MYLLGDIGNSETKLCLVSKKNKILKKIIFSTKDINQKKFEKSFKNLKVDYKKIEKILFCSVVPKSFNLIKKYLFKKIKVRCYEVKNLGLKSLIKIKVNYKQVGSDRITNAISLMNNKDNFIITMLKNLFKKKQSLEVITTSEADVALRLMFEIAISDGTLDKSELKLIKKRADKIATEDEKATTIVKRIIDETEESVSFYPSIKKINSSYSIEDKIELLKVLWELVTADSVVDAYEENLYFKIAELIQVKRSKANQIKQEVN